jgi:hypothetical protein
MQMAQRAVGPLRVFLVLLFGLLVLLQVVSLPGQFAHLAQEQPDLAYLRWPATAVAVLLVLCVQVVIVSTWKLLGLVEDDRIFSAASMVWVDAIVRAIGVAWAVLGGVFLHVGLGADDPGVLLVLLLMVLGVSVVGLLMLVMRALLWQATVLRTDLEAVI